jgi:hypothetical protein
VITADRSWAAADVGVTVRLIRPQVVGHHQVFGGLPRVLFQSSPGLRVGRNVCEKIVEVGLYSEEIQRTG